MPELRVPSLADHVVRLRAWRETDVPAQLAAFGDPLFQRFFKGTRRDTVVFSLRPGEPR